LRLPKVAIRIICGFITRINNATDEVAISFNLQDKSFIESRDAIYLQRLIWHTLEQGAKLELNKKLEMPIPGLQAAV
jgi:hypothetical protein